MTNKFRAILDLGDVKLPLFPQSKKRTYFISHAEAEKRAVRKLRGCPARLIVYPYGQPGPFDEAGQGFTREVHTCLL